MTSRIKYFFCHFGVLYFFVFFFVCFIQTKKIKDLEELFFFFFISAANMPNQVGNKLLAW